MKLTHKNYYTPKNKYLSYSKIKDYLKDKRYFYERHITHEKEKSVTPSLNIGSAVDCYVTEGREKFEKKFKAVKRRNKKEPSTKYIELTQSEYDLAKAIGERVASQDATKELKDFQSQKILQVDMPIGKHFKGFCGIPDWFQIFGRVACIVDLKTTTNLDKYEYTAEKYDYYLQQAMYQLLIGTLYPEVEEFVSLHLVVEKDADKIFNCGTFELSPTRIHMEKKRLLKIVKELKRETTFKPNNVSFMDAPIIGGRWEQ